MAKDAVTKAIFSKLEEAGVKLPTDKAFRAIKIGRVKPGSRTLYSKAAFEAELKLASAPQLVEKEIKALLEGLGLGSEVAADLHGRIAKSLSLSPNQWGEIYRKQHEERMVIYQEIQRKTNVYNSLPNKEEVGAKHRPILQEIMDLELKLSYTYYRG